MIRYDLSCPSDHAFDTWFPSAAAFEVQLQAGQVACPICGSPKIAKSLMAPAVTASRSRTNRVAPGDLSRPDTDLQQAMAAMRRQVEENSEYVGMNFVAEARRIHEGSAVERSIYGEAKPDEARRLIEDGVKVAPLPFMPARKVN